MGNNRFLTLGWGHPMIQNTGRCPRCKQFLIAEQIHNHSCKIALKGVRSILIDHYFETREENGDCLVIARGMDGYFCRLTQCHHIPVHKASDDSYHPESSDEDLTEPSRI